MKTVKIILIISFIVTYVIVVSAAAYDFISVLDELETESSKPDKVLELIKRMKADSIRQQNIIDTYQHFELYHQCDEPCFYFKK